MPPVGVSKVSSKIFCLKKLKWLASISCKRPESIFSIFKEMHLYCSIQCHHCGSRASDSTRAHRCSYVPVKFHVPKRGGVVMS